MTQYSILGRLRLMIELDETGALEALPFCAAAAEQLLPQTKPESRNDPRLDQAGAAIACCMLLQRALGAEKTQDEFEGISSFKAGDITVTKKEAGGGSSAKERMAWAGQARQAAMEDIRDLLKDTGFYAAKINFSASSGAAGRPHKRAKGAKKS